MHQLFWYGIALFVFFGLFVESILSYMFFYSSLNTIDRIVNYAVSGTFLSNNSSTLPIPEWLWVILLINRLIIMISIILILIGMVKSIGLEVSKAMKEEGSKTIIINEEIIKSPKKLKK